MVNCKAYLAGNCLYYCYSLSYSSTICYTCMLMAMPHGIFYTFCHPPQPIKQSHPAAHVAEMQSMPSSPRNAMGRSQTGGAPVLADGWAGNAELIWFW